MSTGSKVIARTDKHTDMMKTLPLLHTWEVTRMPFSQRPTSHLLIESQTPTIWPWNDLDLGVTFTSFMTLTSDKLNWCPSAKLAFSMKWPWPNDLGMTLTSFMTFTSDKSNQVKTDAQVAKLAFSMRWPWPNNLDTQTWPRYCQDVPPHQKWSLYVNWFKSYSLNTHTHTHTHTHYENITSTAYAGGKYYVP